MDALYETLPFPVPSPIVLAADDDEALDDAPAGEEDDWDDEDEWDEDEWDDEDDDGDEEDSEDEDEDDWDDEDEWDDEVPLESRFRSAMTGDEERSRRPRLSLPANPRRDEKNRPARGGVRGDARPARDDDADAD